LSKDSKQSFLSWLVAITTLTLYTGWMHILIGLFIAGWFNWTARYILIALWSTVFLPARPVLWNAFCRCATKSCGGLDQHRISSPVAAATEAATANCFDA